MVKHTAWHTHPVPNPKDDEPITILVPGFRCERCPVVKLPDLPKFRIREVTKVATTAVPEVQQVIPPVPTAPVVKKSSIFEKAICLNVGRKWPSLSKTVKTKVLTTTADPGWIHAQKDLYNCSELKKIFSWDAKIDAYLDTRCLPFPLKRGVYLLPVDLYEEVETALTNHLVGLEPLVDKFASVLADAVAHSKERLGDQFDPRDYPTVEQAKSSFRFYWQYLNFNVADQLRQVDKKIFEREQQKLEAEWVEASSAIQDMLRANMANLVTHMVERLTPEPVVQGQEPKKKIFRDSMLNNINDFLRVFDARNLSNDDELKLLVDKARAMTNGISPEIIRNNEGLRDALQKGFSQIKTNLDVMVTNAPRRAIELEGD